MYDKRVCMGLPGVSALSRAGGWGGLLLVVQQTSWPLVDEIPSETSLESAILGNV